MLDMLEIFNDFDDERWYGVFGPCTKVVESVSSVYADYCRSESLSA